MTTLSASVVNARRSFRFDAVRRLLRNRLARVSSAAFALILLSALLAGLLTGYDPTRISLAEALQEPSAAHPLGTDQLGRDSFARLLYGGQVSLTIGLACALVAAGAGTSLGLVAGYARPRFSLPLVAVSDLLLAFPTLLFAIFLVATIGASVATLILAIGIREVPVYVRLVRSMVLSLKETEFVLASRAVGSRNVRIIARHIFPNTLGVVVVQSTFLVARAVITAAGLGFLGLGVPAPTPEWGAMLADARPYLATHARLMAIPGVMLMITVLTLNVLGDAVRDLLDPRMKNVGA